MNKLSIRIVCTAMAVILALFSGITVTVYTESFDFKTEADKITEYRLSEADSADIQSFINGYITQKAGTSEADWYACSFARSGEYDFSSYLAALDRKSDAGNATERQRIAISRIMTGEFTDNASAVLDETYGRLGIMSEIYGLILMKLSGCGDTRKAADDIVSRQLDDGGWALSGNVSDPDVTSMALCALSGISGYDHAVETALNRLSVSQLDNGGWKSFGAESSESCSQVIIALTALGIDIFSDSRFIKNGNTAADALMSFRNSDGGFSHIHGGKSNSTATVQAFMAITSLNCGSFYIPYQFGTPSMIPTQPQSVSEAPVNPTESAVTTVHTDVTATVPADTSATEAVTANSQTETAAAETITAIANSITTASETKTAVSSRSSTQNSVETITSAVTETNTESVIFTADESGNNAPMWKYAAAAMIAVTYGVTLIYLAARKQLSIKKTAAGGALSAVCIGTIMWINIQTPEEYYRRHIDDVQPDSLTFTLEVNAENAESGRIIIPETEYVLIDGDTAFSALERVLAYHKISIDYDGLTGSDAYIKGIDGLYEFDFGEMSGWMYMVNGEFPSVGCGNYELSDGDRVEFIYTRNIGKDIEDE